MNMKVYAVLDAKLGTFGGLFLDMTDDAAIRGFSDGVNDPKQINWNRHPEDYALYRIGDYNSSNGKLSSLETLDCLVTAGAVKSLKNGQQLEFDVGDLRGELKPAN